MLWCCWLGDRKGIRPVNNWGVLCWRGYLSGARCRLAYGPSDATATHCLLLQWNPDFFTFLVPAYPGSLGQRAVKRVCVCVCVCVCIRDKKAGPGKGQFFMSKLTSAEEKCTHASVKLDRYRQTASWLSANYYTVEQRNILTLNWTFCLHWQHLQIS